MGKSLIFSTQWRTILQKLSEFDGYVNYHNFCSLMGDDEDRSKPCDAALMQMYFMYGHTIWERSPYDRDMIRITDRGRKWSES